MSERPFISAIICTHNRAESLRETLDSFYAQDFPDDVPFELLVIDNGSTDDTASVAQTFADRPGYQYHHEAELGLSPARNRGIQESTGEVVAFLDDDVIVDREWLRQLARCYHETGADVVGGRAHLILRGNPPTYFGKDFRLYLSEVDLGDRRIDAGEGRRLYGLNVSFRRTALEVTNAFADGLGRKGSEMLCGEERQLCAAIHARGGKLLYEPTAQVGHVILPERLQWDYFVRLCRGAGISRARLDPPAVFPVRLGRVLETLAKLVLYAGLLLPALCLGPNAYPFRALRCRLIRISTLLGARWQSLY